MSFGSLGRASVDITADLSGYEAALAKLPGKFAAAEAKIRAEMARNRLDMKSFLATGATASGAAGNYDALAAKQEQLKAKLQSVAKAAGEAAGALNQGAEAAGRMGGMAGRAGGAFAGMGDKGGYGAMKLMILAQTMDDLQYGFRAIVNNIPMLLQAFGVPEKAAAAISIGAVALNQFITKWGEWADLLKDTPLKPVVEEVNKLAKAWGSANEAAEAHARGLKEAQAKAKANAGEVSGIKPAGQAEVGGGVEDAIKAFGGGDKLRQWLLDNVKAGRSFQDAETLFNDVITRAKAGEAGAIDQLTDLTKGTRLPGLMDENSPRAKAEKEQAEKEVERQHIEQAHAMDEYDREVKKAEADRQKKANDDLREANREAEDYLKTLKKEEGTKVSQVHGIESYLTAIQTAATKRDEAANQVPGKIDVTNQKLDTVNQNLAKLKLARFG